jgi:hypothetical protein
VRERKIKKLKNKRWKRERESEREGEFKKKFMEEGKGDRGRARLKN